MTSLFKSKVHSAPWPLTEWVIFLWHRITSRFVVTGCDTRYPRLTLKYCSMMNLPIVLRAVIATQELVLCMLKCCAHALSNSWHAVNKHL